MATLVTGGSGRIGRLIVDGLVARGQTVAVLSRGAAAADLPDGVTRVPADLTGTIPAGTFRGVDQLFLFPAEGDLAPALRQAAQEGVGHVVVLSSLAAAGEHERDLVSDSGTHHRAVEAAVRDSGLPATILRPGTFATNLLFWAHAIRFTGGVDGPYPSSAQALVHEADVADVAVEALTGTRLRGGVHAFTGPQALTQVEQLDAIRSALGRELTYRTVAPEQYAADMSRWMAPGIVAMLLRYWAETVDRPDVPRSTQPLTGRSRTLATWARDHAADFA